MQTPQAKSKRLPAFGRELLAKRRQGLVPSTDLCISTEWKLGRAWRWRLVVTPDLDPQTLDFAVAAGLSCILVGHEQARLDAIARELLRLPLIRLVGFCLADPKIAKITIYLPER